MNNGERQPSPPSRHEVSHEGSRYLMTFIGFSIGNLIGDELFDTGFDTLSAFPRAAIATGLMYIGSKAVQKFRG